MDDKIPFIPIKEFEAENMEKLMDMEARADDIRYGLNTQPNPRSNHTIIGDNYSESVDLILEGMGLGKYIENFKTHDVGLNVLLDLTPKDLEILGVTDLNDLELFKTHLIDFNGAPKKINTEFYKIEEDLIMARNVFTHLEDINTHLNFLKFKMKKKRFTDYFVNSNHSMLKVFEIVINRTIAQARNMSNVLFSGTFTSDCLIGDCLNADNLELPDFMKTKLLNPNKEFGVSAKAKPKKKYYRFISSASALALGVYFSIIIFQKFTKK